MQAMREVKRSALIAETPARMFELINDIESYPSFVPGCTAARVVSRKEGEVVPTPVRVEPEAPRARPEPRVHPSARGTLSPADLTPAWRGREQRADLATR